ncbi:EAL domain-containing protein (putative c-di-GMP-specific phosphodiesterase class I) [Buttiauxella sp. BIGb0471]|uniref:sensor domain-containing phosphodiesterase n=1 Tax=Buttiauxella sp. BIGb0471 TaxID=2940597 RepID=UPI00216710A0|nr:sensor domain-containing phosphodiesterase [Buttiauxella sp. BIGb0471]MCS3603148.1 EAL domain-containing protein (putative c-di-GMP-specific phosphodiesterase class I) [Buttiauxella sp. BIGb0471]
MMQISSLYNKYKDNWWALPLILPFILYPIAQHLSTYGYIDGFEIPFNYLNMALMTVLTMIYGFKAIPGIILCIFYRIYPDRGFEPAIMSVLHYFTSIAISCAGYYYFTGKKGRASFGCYSMAWQRIFWLIFVNATLFLNYFQAVLYLGMFGVYDKMMYVNPFTIRTLINYHAMLVGNMIGLPMIYLAIRSIRTPGYLIKYCKNIRNQVAEDLRALEFICLFSALILLTTLMIYPRNHTLTLMNSVYTLTLLLPVMIWGTLRLGHAAISLIWWVILIVLCKNYQSYIPNGVDYNLHLAVATSCFSAFSITITLMAINISRQRALNVKTKRLMSIDPVVHLPNLLALDADLKQNTISILCQLYAPDLELLGRHYGLLMQVQYKQQLAQFLKPVLKEDERIYISSGHDLIVRMSPLNAEKRIAELYNKAIKFRFIRDGVKLYPQIGCSYCIINYPVGHLYMLIGELRALAEISLTTNLPVDMRKHSSRQVQNQVKTKVDMMNQLQHALELDRFVLMAQPIESKNGDRYHEVLLRMRGNNDEIIFPDTFLPVAHEFGMSSSIDLWVLNNTMKFMDENRDLLPNQRFAINLTPASICRADMAALIERLLIQHGIAPEQIVLEVTETDELTNNVQAEKTLDAMQRLGCKIAIDDFGTGYASYARLKNMRADILKIDGSFIHKINSSEMDYKIVQSICELARMKNMTLVAEFVETEEIRHTLFRMGVDYVQGYLIGKPAPIESIQTIN